MIERCIGLQKIVEARGLMSEIAKRCGITRFAVAQWKHVPEDRLEVVMELSGLPASELKRDRIAEWRGKLSGAARKPMKRRKKRWR